jgi:hypothetical protein
MSFMDNISKAVGGLFGGAGGADAGAAAQNLTGHLNSMDPATLGTFGQQLLNTFTSHTGYPGDGAQAAAAAGTTPEAVASGAPGAIGSLISYAQQNPQVMQACMTAFQEKNPAALAQFAPGLMQHLTGKPPEGTA